MKGRLEGLESCYDSEGLGCRTVAFYKLPAVGERFNCIDRRWPLSTGTVQSMRKDGNRISFRTRRTTYVLDIEEENASE